MAKLNITYRNFCKRTTKNEFSKIWGTLSDNNIVFLFYVNQFAHYCQISLPQSFPSLFSLHFCFPDCCVLRTPAIISQVYSHYIFAYRIAACFALPQSFPSIRISWSFRFTLCSFLGRVLSPVIHLCASTGGWLDLYTVSKKNRSHHFMFSLIKWWLPIYSFKIDVLFITNFLITNT